MPAARHDDDNDIHIYIIYIYIYKEDILFSKLSVEEHGRLSKYPI